MPYCTSLRAIIVRLLFAFHGLISIWRLYDVKKDVRYWYFAIALAVLLLETTVTLGKKGGNEWKWVCPSVFVYLSSVVPAIWFLELHELDKRIDRMIHNNNTQEIRNETSEELSASLGGVFGFEWNIRIPLALTSDQWIRTLEQLLLLILIVGRWLLPKGKLTHDQLSQLLLVYIGTAADIVEFFEAFKEPVVKFNRVLCMLILGIWSLSLLQFSLVLTAASARRDKSALCPKNTNRKNRIGCCQADVYGIIVSILMQDAPFLVLRMWLIFRHNVLSYTNMFFTSKNSLVIILLIYRLIVMQIEKSSVESRDDMADSRSNRSRDNLSMTDTSTVGSKSHLVNSVSCSNDTTPRTGNKRRDDRVRLARTPTPDGLNSPV